MGALLDFLQRNQIAKADAPPLCHTTEAYYLKKIISSGQIKTARCNVFKGEDLSYFFVGRPAFKREIESEAEYWELPICIVLDFKSFKPKRVYPFDTGAYKANRYPPYITMMDMDEFEVSDDISAAEKIIGTFFVNSRNYFNLKARSFSSFESLFEVETLDEEIHAIHRLIGFKNEKADDRRFAIEFQHDACVDLTPHNVKAVVVPEIYLESDKVRSYIIKHLGAALLSYPVYPLKKDYYYYAIYQQVDGFMRRGGYFGI